MSDDERVVVQYGTGANRRWRWPLRPAMWDGSRHESVVARLSMSGSLRFMRFCKFTSDKTVRRLRWLVAGIIFVDAAFTLLGQPSTYWHDYQTAVEGNPFIRQYLCRGYAPFCLVMFTYAAFAVSLVSILPRRAGLATAFAYLFAHFFSTEAWLMYHWKWGGIGLLIYGFTLGVAVVVLVFPKPAVQDGSQTPPDNKSAP